MNDQELNRALTEKLFGLLCHDYINDDLVCPSCGRISVPHEKEFDFLSDWNGAQKIVEAMQKLGWKWRPHLYLDHAWATFSKDGGYGGHAGADGTTLPRATALAALAAFGQD